MSHPSEATLALFAGRDLGWFARRRTERHLAGCEHCQRAVDAYRSLRSVLPDLSEAPGLHWNRMAAEMKANIRLGLAAGECVREPAAERYPRLFGSRALVSYASIAALVVASLLLERPAPKMPAREAAEVTLRATPTGIEVKEGARTMSLLHRRGADVNVLVGAQGSMRARYVDSETGYVTINNVYAQ